VLTAGRGWVILGALKQIGGALLAFLAIRAVGKNARAGTDRAISQTRQTGVPTLAVIAEGGTTSRGLCGLRFAPRALSP
jgi:hypothetical protein